MEVVWSVVHEIRHSLTLPAKDPEIRMRVTAICCRERNAECCLRFTHSFIVQNADQHLMYIQCMQYCVLWQ